LDGNGKSKVALIIAALGYGIVAGDCERGSLNFQALPGVRSPQSLATKAFSRIRSRLPYSGAVLLMSADVRLQSAPVPRSQNTLKLREARFEDHSQVAALASKNHLYVESYPEWTHLWTDNPAYRDIKDTFPMGWVLENKGGAISGYLGNVPLHYELEGKRLLAVATRAWVVDSACRPYSPLLLGTFFKQRNVDLFLNTTVSAEAAAAYSIFQGIRVPVGVWDRTLFWITHFQGFTESFLRGKRVAMAKALSYPLAAGVFLRDQAKRSRFQAAVKVLPCASFDDRFDAFWASVRQKKPKILLAVRSREALQWHFKFALQQDAAWIYIVEGNSGLAAYSVFLRQDSLETGLKRVRLADFQCLEQGSAPELLAAMLQAALDRCRQEPIHMLELIGLTDELEQKLERLSPHGRPLPTWMYYYKPNNPVLAESLKNAAVWEPSLFDGDSSLCSLTAT
jgi:hypothetical protein